MFDCLQASKSFVLRCHGLVNGDRRRERHVTLAPAMETNALFILPCQSAASDNSALYHPIFQTVKGELDLKVVTVTRPDFFLSFVRTNAEGISIPGATLLPFFGKRKKTRLR